VNHRSIPNELSHVDGSAAKHVNHVNFRSTCISVAAKSPAFVAIIIVHVEDGKIVGIQAMALRNRLASFRNPASTPIIPIGMGRVQIVAKTTFKAAVIEAWVHFRLVWVGSKREASADDGCHCRLEDHFWQV
jgi:hypothetical protein